MGNVSTREGGGVAVKHSRGDAKTAYRRRAKAASGSLGAASRAALKITRPGAMATMWRGASSAKTRCTDDHGNALTRYVYGRQTGAARGRQRDGDVNPTFARSVACTARPLKNGSPALRRDARGRAGWTAVRGKSRKCAEQPRCTCRRARAGRASRPCRIYRSRPPCGSRQLRQRTPLGPTSLAHRSGARIHTGALARPPTLPQRVSA